MGCRDLSSNKWDADQLILEYCGEPYQLITIRRIEAEWQQQRLT
jgi:hypothetical protein